jgi:hypothetical protein
LVTVSFYERGLNNRVTGISLAQNHQHSNPNLLFNSANFQTHHSVHIHHHKFLPSLAKPKSQQLLEMHHKRTSAMTQCQTIGNDPEV